MKAVIVLHVLSPLEVCVDSVKCVAVTVRVLELHAAGEA